MFKKPLSAFLSALVCLSGAMTPVWAEPAANSDDEIIQNPIFFEDDSEVVIPEVDIDNDELLDEYLNTIIYEEVADESVSFDLTYSTADTVANGCLSENAMIFYRGLKENAAKIASGEVTSTKFTFDLTEYPLKTTFDAADIGLSAIKVNGSLVSDAQSKFKSALSASLDFTNVLTCLLEDNPYLMYWFDKTKGSSYSYSYGLYSNEEGTDSVFKVRSMTITMYVAPGYNADDTYLVLDTTAVDTAEEAVANAKTIVAKHFEESDYEKICSYRDEVMDLTAYDTLAASMGDFSSYGSSNPWQIIWVFDGDPNTNVVCEGYSKAFQYLCELSEFNSDLVECYSVTGYLDYDGHMWNIVVMDDGVPYLVDVTNSDEGTVGDEGDLFLKGADEGDPESGYFVMDYSYTFTYDNNTLNTVSHDVLNISLTDYEPVTVPSVTSNHVSFDWNYANSGFVKDINLTADGSTKLPQNAYARTGYVFKNWNTAIDGSGTSYEAGATVNGLISTESENVVLYAQWEKDSEYNVRFDWNYANGGTVNDMKAYAHGEFVFPENGFTKNNATFAGWNTKMDGKGTAYQPGDTVEGISADTTFYAMWTATPSVTVSFDWNYGNRGGMNPVVAYEGEKVTIPANGFEKDNYTFTGWNTKMDGSGKAVSNLSEEDLYDLFSGKNGTLYAQWTENSSFVLSFDWNYANSGFMADKKGYGSVIVPECGYTRNGYTFSGWNTIIDGSGTSYKPGDILESSENVRLFAQWAAE